MRFAATLVLLSIASGQGVIDEPSWWEAESRASDRLERRDATVLAAETSKLPPTREAGELLYRLDVHFRAGHDADTLQALDALAAAEPPLPPVIAGEAIQSMIGRKERALAIAAIERFPKAQAGWTYVLMKDWAAEAGWEAVDAWAAKLQDAEPTFWLRERLRLRAEHGKSGVLFAQLVADAKAHPDDVQRFLTLRRLRGEVTPAPDLDWMAPDFRPRSAFDAAQLALEVRGAPAVVLLERALAMPIQDEDIPQIRDWVSHRCSIPKLTSGDDGWRQWLVNSMRWALVEAYRSSGEAQKAQELLVALAKENPGADGVPAISLFLAGAVQAESGGRVIESAVRAAEDEQHESAEYWTKRADYFAGRGERSQELEAVDRALALSRSDPEGGGSYFLILRRAKLLGSADGFAFLALEIARLPVDSRYEGFLLNRLVEDYGDLLVGHEQLIWRHLEGNDTWDIGDERLLRFLVEHCDAPKLGEFWARAEKVAADQPGLRTPTLALIAHRHGDAPRAALLLAQVMALVPHGGAREAAAITLFEASRDIGKWKLADAVWPVARRRLTPDERAPWLADLALAQAKAGEADMAMRTWARAANLDRRELSELSSMAAAGLRERLVAFYTDLAERDPATAPLVERVLRDLAR
ncbi:MAG TPA: hypothetical protein VK843_10655 [Planctomycetota bacterium]|nr:hypothetical protein [Planctomycetota bacterium]